jgi:hypothetical protein
VRFLGTKRFEEVLLWVMHGSPPMLLEREACPTNFMPKNSYDETESPLLMVFGDGAYGR